MMTRARMLVGRSQSRRWFSSSPPRQRVSRDSRSVSPPRRLERRGFYLTTLSPWLSFGFTAWTPWFPFSFTASSARTPFCFATSSTHTPWVSFHFTPSPTWTPWLPFCFTSAQSWRWPRTCWWQVKYGANYCVSYAMITVVSQGKSQWMVIIYTWWASMPRPINPEGYRSNHELTEMKS